MILNEPIIKVLELQYKEEYLQEWHNAYLHTTGAFEYHVTEGYWLLFETENYYATIGYDGVQKYKKPYEFPTEKFDLWGVSYEEWTDYQDTLFANQKIHSIEKHENFRTIYFDDFKLDLYVYGENDTFSVHSASFGDGINVMAVGEHLLQKCKCGGKAELLCDEHSDFAVRCKDCHRATYFDMILKDQIDVWNNGDTPCFIHTGAEKLKELLKTQKIKYIALSSESGELEMVDETFCYCFNVMICFENAIFMLSSEKVKGFDFNFTGRKFTDYNKKFWTNVIKPTESILFVGEKEDNAGRKILHFMLDDTDLFIKAIGYELAVALDEVTSPLSTKRKKLFCDGVNL